MLGLLVYLVILALVYWFITIRLPLPPPIKIVVDLIFLLIAIFLLLSFVGGSGALSLPSFHARC